jgi:uroporphyrinogen-III synthase
MMDSQGFAGLRVLSLESRRAQEMTKLIANYGGRPVVAPSMREVPLESNARALEFAGMLVEGQLDIVIFLTGVGTRALMRVVETRYPRQQFVDALRRVVVVARGPKPAAALREMEVPISVLVPEPHTWRELLRALDEDADESEKSRSDNQPSVPGSLRLSDRRVAVQEYGVSNPELLTGLEQRGASVLSVPVYEWTLPEDTGPLQSAVTALVQGEIDVVMFTSSAQIQHLLQVARAMGRHDQLLGAFGAILVASIGPVTSEGLAQHGIGVDLEPSRPKMGFLVREAAERSRTLVEAKRRKL